MFGIYITLVIVQCNTLFNGSNDDGDDDNDDDDTVIVTRRYIYFSFVLMFM